MNRQKLEEKLLAELEVLESLEIEYKSAKSDYDYSEERNIAREDGSPRQDQLNEQILQHSKDRYGKACKRFDEQTKVVEDIRNRISAMIK